ncbi:hypothetical protein [Arenibaculum sp.]|jgi:hypothetical protein|uniref:hypothetical protein n=1 Tax=Arenibaculum sp. TaxID=2865862 RepID=UPI002E0FAAA2|nr:hypothetical protein [Arenibaculum sp.]
MKYMLTAASLLALATVPAAWAQQAPATTPAYENLPAEDFATPGAQIPLNAFDLPPEVDETIRERMGPEQTRLELVQTMLLNAFGQLGFARLLDITERGQTYVARVLTVAGDEAALGAGVQADRERGRWNAALARSTSSRIAQPSA